jgi:tetratricopeptide (TPR) repeat protein/TolB-like protein
MLCSMCGRDTAQLPGGVCVACNATRSDAASRGMESVTGYAGGLDEATVAPAAAARGDTSDHAVVTSLANSATPQTHHNFFGPLAPGTSFGNRYRIIRLLGAGGMGAVYQAWDDELGEAVALKVIRPEANDPDAVRGLERRFKRELVLARQVTHKNVVRIHDLGEIGGIKYLTMPYIQGSDLAAFLRREGKLPLPRAMAIARQIAMGLQAAHEAGVVHRDLKPANVMLDSEDRAIIMDFGIARSISGGAAAGTVAGAVVGTLEYMAPEQAMGRTVDHRADIYAFGLILYDMLVGRRPSARAESAVAALLERIHRPLPPLRSIDPTVPEPVDALVATCIQPDPAARFQTTAELLAAFDGVVGNGQTATASQSAVHPRVRTALSASLPAAEAAPAAPKPSKKWAAVVAGLALVVIVGALAIWFRTSSSPPSAVAKTSAAATSIAVVPFRNATGDSTLDWMGASVASLMKDAVSAESGIRAVPADRVDQILADLRVTPDVDPDEGTVRRLAEFSAAEHVLTGKYVRVGSRIRIQGSLRNMKTASVAELTVDAADQGDLTNAVQQLSGDVRRRLAASDHVPTLAQALAPTTGSHEALQSFTEGIGLRRRGKHLEALERFKQAVTADPAFALAHSKLAETYASLGQDSAAERASRDAVQRADQLPAREKYEVLAAHARLTNDHEKAISAYENLAKLAPNDSQVLFDLANLYEATNAYDQAHAKFLEVSKLDPQFSNAVFALGRIEIRRGYPEAALDPLNRALSLAIKTNNDELKGSALNAIGVAYRLLGKPEESVRYYSEALEIRRRIGDQRGVAATLNELGQVHAQVGRPREAMASFEESLKIRRELNDRRGTGNVLLDLGNLYTARGDYEKSLSLFKESLQIQTDVGDDNGQGLCLNNIGNVYILQGRYDEALTSFERALNIWERLKLSASIADSVHNIAETLAYLGQYDKALSQYLRAIELRRASNDRRGAAIESFGMAAVFEQQGRYKAALDAREEAVKTLRQLNEPQWLAEMLIGYGTTLVLVGQNEQARKVLDEALALARNLGNQRLTALALNAQGSDFFYRGEFKAARPAFTSAQRALANTVNRDVELSIRLNLAKLDVKEGRGRAAVATLRALTRQAEEMRMRAVAAEGVLYLGESLLAGRDFAAARSELETALDRAQRLGLRPLAARSHYLLSITLKNTGDQSGAARHLAEARQIVEALRKEAGTNDLLARDDLRPIASGAAPVL